MSKTLQRDIYYLRYPGISIDQVKPANQDLLTPVRYSCVYWVDHLYEVDSSKSQYQGDLRMAGQSIYFCKNHIFTGFRL